jgi:organic radical activating enzyme
MNSKTFCIAPWTSACIHTDAHLSPCCQWVSSHNDIADPARIKQLDRYKSTYIKKDTHSETTEQQKESVNFTQIDQWANSNYMKKVRENQYNGVFIEPCNRCYDDERAGVESTRQSYNKSWSRYFDFAKIDKEEWSVDVNSLFAFDFKLGNTCNLKCVMCTPILSSPLMTEYKKNQKKFKNLKFYKEPLSGKDFTSWPEKKEFLDFFEKIKKQILWMKFTGGEPTILPSVNKILNEMPNPESITLSITTNGTRISDELLQTLSKYKKVWLTISIEGIGDHNNIIRYLSSWDKIAYNILRLKKLSNVYLEIQSMLMCFSPFTSIKIFQWAEENELKLSFSKFVSPSYLSIDSVKPELIKKFDNQLKKLHSKNNQEVVYQIIQYLKDHNYQPNLEIQRDRYIKMLDTIRNTNLKEKYDFN